MPPPGVGGGSGQGQRRGDGGLVPPPHDADQPAGGGAGFGKGSGRRETTRGATGTANQRGQQHPLGGAAAYAAAEFTLIFPVVSCCFLLRACALASV